MAVKYTQTYKSYEDADAAARRAQALADALQQQAYRPIEMSALAPVSYTEGLAKVLQAYMAGRQQSKAEEAKKAAAEKVAQTSSEIAGRLTGSAPMRQVNTTPGEGGLAEVEIQSQYRRNPMQAMQLASSNVGQAALRGNPLLAAMLSKSMETPEAKAMLVGNQLLNVSGTTATPITMGGQAVKEPDKPDTPTEFARTLKEKADLVAKNPNDPLIKEYDAKLAAMTSAPGTVFNLGSPMIVKNPATGKNELYQPNPRGGAGRFVGEAEPAEPALKPLPASVAEDFAQNAKHKSQIQLGLDLLEGKTVNVGGKAVKGDPKAVGMKGILPQAVLNRKDPGGVETRAAIANISSMTIKNRSGANVTVGEEPRLMPFIPGPSDDNPTIQKKLRGLLNEIENEDRARSQIYGVEQGYKPFELPNTKSGLSESEEAEYQQLKAKAKRGG